MVNAAHSGRPRTGVRFVFALDGVSSGVVNYRGVIGLETGEFDVCVSVRAKGERGDGLQAEATAPELPADQRSGLETLAARLVLPVVRRARRAGVRPPRHIRRWRKAA